MAKSLTAVIYLEPNQVSLRIIELPSLKVVNNVQSGALMVGTEKIANYAQNMEAIVNNLDGFKQLVKDIKSRKYRFTGPWKTWMRSQPSTWPINWKCGQDSEFTG